MRRDVKTYLTRCEIVYKPITISVVMGLLFWGCMIDHQFVNELEGGTVLKGYVPCNKDGHVIGRSGVTIANGFDIGQYTAAQLRKMFLIPVGTYRQCIEPLHPYTEVKGQAAYELLKKYPLSITRNCAEIIEGYVRHYHTMLTMNDWNRGVPVSFGKLPDRVQTVLFSLGYNFGPTLSVSLPQTFRIFRACAIKNDYREAVAWLQKFPSKNPELKSRRLKEAQYLAAIV